MHSRYRVPVLLLSIWLGLMFLGGCVGRQPAPTMRPEPTPVRPLPDTALASSTGLLGAASGGSIGPIKLAIDPGMSSMLAGAARQALESAGAKVEIADSAGLVLTTDVPDEVDSARLVYENVLVPVDRFSTVLDEITLDELRGVWAGTATTLDFSTIYPADEAMPALVPLLGNPSPAVKPLPAAEVADALWSDRMGLGIVPFEALSLRVRALRLDGLSATDNRLKSGHWVLGARVWLRATSRDSHASLARLPYGPLQTNRDLTRITIVTMTGVTELTRGIAAAIAAADDPAFPAREVGPELAAADITTTSNEFSFVDGCVPDNRKALSTFCADTSYFATLELSGIKIVGLTGNHLNDFGTNAFLKTLDLYRSKGIQFYGGGADDAQARAPVIVRHNDNTLAFIGANQFGPAAAWSYNGDKVSAWAGPDTPGSARYDRDQMSAAVAALRPQATVVFAELQYQETNAAGEYQTEPLPGQPADFRALLDAGADVVTGVHAHTPQAIELRGNGLILYGLGNLYVDQTSSWPTSTGLVARHTVYAGRLINTELLVTVIEKNMQVRWATPDERIKVLRTVFSASGW